MAVASHELRTPVAILRGESEVALSQQARSAEEYRESLGVLHHEAERLTRIVEDLFTLTRADTGQYPLQPRDLYLDEDRKSTRLNSSHGYISYAVFCLQTKQSHRPR